MSYINENKSSYDEIYKKGWGNQYPNSNMISYYFNYIKPLLQARGGVERKLKMLDFGCSIGANTRFFAEQGFEVYGIDISEIAIARCIERNKFPEDHFKALNILDYNDLGMVFGTKFDLIVASEVLYYFDKKDAGTLLELFNGSLAENGIIYANWVTFNMDFYRKYKKPDLCMGQIKVSNTGSIGEDLNVYVVENKQEIEEMFHVFDTKYIKSTCLELDGENESIHYIGVKK